MTVTIMIGDVREKPSKIDIAYCAGVIDSDGTIGIKRLTYSMRVVGDSRQATFAARICVRQVQPEAVELLKTCFGGSIRINKTTTQNRRDQFSWEVRDQLAETALKYLMPFLRIKKAQAENCLHLRHLIAKSKLLRVAKGRGHVGAASRPEHITEQMEAAYLAAKALNIVGIK